MMPIDAFEIFETFPVLSFSFPPFKVKQETKEAIDFQLITNLAITPSVKQILFSATFQKKKIKADYSVCISFPLHKQVLHP